MTALSGVLKYNWLDMQKTRKVEKSQALRMTILWELDENALRQVSAYGTQHWVSVRP